MDLNHISGKTSFKSREIVVFPSINGILPSISNTGDFINLVTAGFRLLPASLTVSGFVRAVLPSERQ